MVACPTLSTKNHLGVGGNWSKLAPTIHAFGWLDEEVNLLGQIIILICQTGRLDGWCDVDATSTRGHKWSERRGVNDMDEHHPRIRLRTKRG